jgi:hypothetical protein
VLARGDRGTTQSFAKDRRKQTPPRESLMSIEPYCSQVPRVTPFASGTISTFSIMSAAHRIEARGDPRPK